MKRIGIISDTHGFLDPKVFHHFESCDEIWHAGDIGSVEVADQLENFKPVKAVWGNIDGKPLRGRYPEDLWFNLEGFTILISHIGGYPPRYNSRMKEILNQKVPDILVCGHSHILKILKDPNFNNLLYINPGAAGKQGLHRVKTLVRITLTSKKVEELQVIELGKRAERVD